MGTDISALQHIYEHCLIISEYLGEANITELDGFLSNRIVQDAVLMRLLAMGELTTHLSDDFKSKHLIAVDWRNLKQLRNVIAHRYGSIQYDVIWDIVQNDVPEIEKFCKKIFENEEDEDFDLEP